MSFSFVSSIYQWWYSSCFDEEIPTEKDKENKQNLIEEFKSHTDKTKLHLSKNLVIMDILKDKRNLENRTDPVGNLIRLNIYRNVFGKEFYESTSARVFISSKAIEYKTKNLKKILVYPKCYQRNKYKRNTSMLTQNLQNMKTKLVKTRNGSFKDAKVGDNPFNLILQQRKKTLTHIKPPKEINIRELYKMLCVNHAPLLRCKSSYASIVEQSLD